MEGTNSVETKYCERKKRIEDAVALREPDRVPIIPETLCFPYLHAGYSMAEILYDTDLSKSKKSLLMYLTDYEPDMVSGYRYNHIGRGPIFELCRLKRLRWAGMPGNIIDKNSIHQFIEFPVLKEDEFEEFFKDRSGWFLSKGLPRQAELLEPFSGFCPSKFTTNGDHTAIAAAFSKPEFKEMIQTLWKIDEMEKNLDTHLHDLDASIEKAGYPLLQTGFAAVPYDHYNDFLRGTLDGMVDMYENTEYINTFCEEYLEQMLELVKLQGRFMPGKQVFMALHKGMDSFMSDEQYKTFYWPHLQKIIQTIIDAGMIPYLFCEGKYNNRLEYLKDVPKGKVIYHFEDVDMAAAKKILGDTACIAGAFPTYLLDYGTKEQVIDEAKRLIDGCAAGGGFLFTTSSGLDQAKEANVEALFDTVKTYGKY